MRMRKKPNLVARLERAGAVMIRQPEELRGRWREAFPGYEQIHLELGCGKGRFTADTAGAEPEIMLLAVERVPDAMVVGMERVLNRGIENVRFLDRDVSGLGEIFAPGEIERIYLNFCDPWPKSRDAKHRLTAPDFLRLYASLLPDGGELRFKTDNKPLFDWSAEQLESELWELRDVTNDLHANGICGVMTDYEAKFHAQGVKINRLVAVKGAETRTTEAGSAPRLRNASLADAKGRADSLAAHRAKEEQV
ncbi:MAG: tRNA (guanosine(46)-N7)-methyltransferase TrmB [Butyricicoccus sp.]|nr:tRNA (guanosine(46)-N7)-methyltransferase TrmB [Butyricicoccus sp.]